MSFALTETIKNYREILETIPVAINAYHRQNELKASEATDRILELINACLESLPEDVVPDFQDNLMNLSKALAAKDDLLTADYLETTVQPLFAEVLGDIVTRAVENGDADEKIEVAKDIYAELTLCGRYTLSVRGIYMHSNSSPVNEAETLAETWYDPEEKATLIWGLGLGYHVMAMLKKDPYRKVFVFEPDKNVIKAYESFGLKPEIDAIGRAEVCYDPDGLKYAELVKKYPDTPLHVHYPSLKAMKDCELKNSLMRYYAPVQSIANQLENYRISFRENTLVDFKGFAEFKFAPEKKRAFIISAGPSLDGNYLELLNRRAEDAVIATAPTLRKLWKAGIKPDCTVISDTKAILKKLHDGVEDADCPLIYSSTASVPFVADHKGPRYMLCQKGFEPAEKLAAEKGWPVFESSGSVAIVALNVAILSDFKEIVFVGQDLCYLGNAMHAEGTSPAEKTIEDNNRKKSADIYGREVTVPLNFEIFRLEMERIISSHKEITFLNATEGGLEIKGAENVKLKEVL